MDANLLTFRGSVVPLTPKAIQTLYLLVSRAPELVSKEEITKNVWPDTFVVESSLTRNISVIRKALEDLAGNGPCIENVPKRGYRFIQVVIPVDDTAVIKPPLGSAVPSASRRALLVGVTSLLLISAGGGVMYRRSVSARAQPHPSTLIGWHLFYKLTPGEVQQALTSFEEAVADNPGSASAQAGLASSLLTLSRLAGIGTESFARAKKAADTAVRLDPGLAVAHAAQGVARMMVDWDMAEGEKCLRRALELDPNTVLALVYLSQLFSATGRLDEALSFARRTAVADPVSPIVGVQVGILMYAQRRFADAEIAFRNVLHRERNFALAHYYLGLNSAYRGKFVEAAYHLSQADLHPAVLQTDRAWLALLQGDRTPAEGVYRDLQAAVQAGKTSSSALVLLAASLGRVDDAFAALEIAARERHPELLMLQSDPRLDPLRGDQRYGQLIRRLKLDVRSSSAKL